MTEPTFDEMKRGFLSTLVRGFVVGHEWVRMGVVLYADEPRYVAPLSTYTDKNNLLWRIANL